jgi:hypothetical protein
MKPAPLMGQRDRREVLTAINHTPPTTATNSLQLTADAERVLDGEALALITSVHDLCGTGVVHDRAWWTAEAKRCGTEWAGILATVAAALEICRRRLDDRGSL